MKTIRAFTMPKWGIEMTEGTLAAWEVGEGEAFKKGDIIALIETDKITNEYEAEFDGALARIIVPEGDTVDVGTLLGIFSHADVSDAEIDAFIAEKGGSATGTSKPKSEPSAPAPKTPPREIPADTAISPAARSKAQGDGVDVADLAGSGRNGRITLQDVDIAASSPADPPAGQPVDVSPTAAHLDNIFASPLAKRLAVQQGIDLAGVSGTGPKGRICKADVLELVPALAPELATASPQHTAASSTGTTGEDRVIVPMSSMRKAIARQLTLSKTTIPHFYLRNEARVDALIALRKLAKRATGGAPSINDYLVRAVAIALQEHPDVNVQVHGDEIHRMRHSEIAVAVATDKGLITPIVRMAETKSVGAISNEIKDLANRARAGRLAAEEFQGGSFSISNLGMFGITQFDAIINPPQGAILAIGTARSETFHQDYAVVAAQRIHLSLSCDHRAIDGAVGARFLARLCELIESPEELTA